MALVALPPGTVLARNCPHRQCAWSQVGPTDGWRAGSNDVSYTLTKRVARLPSPLNWHVRSGSSTAPTPPLALDVYR